MKKNAVKVTVAISGAGGGFDFGGIDAVEDCIRVAAEGPRRQALTHGNRFR